MKTSPFLVAAVASLLPTLTMGLVGISWSAANVPNSGFTDITFPFSIEKSPHKTGYFFAQQFKFQGNANVGHAGLQPRPDSEGGAAIHAVFSSFIGGTTTTDANCSPDADGPGVSCSVEFSGPYADTYNIEIRNTGGTTWDGTLVDAVTGSNVHIGSYTLPSGTQGIEGSQSGFVEYYPWNSGSHTCASLPYTSVVFGVPKTSQSVGSLSEAYEYGDCVGKVAYESHRTELGVEVSAGFK